MDAIGGLMTLISKIPGVGDRLKPAMDAIDNFQSKMNRTLTGTEGALDFAGVAQNAQAQAAQQWATRPGAVISNNTTVTRNTNATVDVNFNNTPAGTTVRSTGQNAPAINLRTGLAGAR